MSPKLESPVQTQMAVAVHDCSVSAEYHGSRGEGKSGGRRHLFAHANAGYSLHSGFDQGDNAHTVKRKIKLAQDLYASGQNFFYSTGKGLQCRDQSRSIEILGSMKSQPHVKHLVGDVARAIRNGVEPVKVLHGLGGAYYFRNTRGENIALVKPADEEPLAPNNPKGMVGKTMGQPGLKRWVRVGETGFREVAAYILDHGHFAQVPPTTLVKITHSIFNINDGDGCNKTKEKNPTAICKIASFQKFIPHDFDASDYGTSGFPVAAVHRIGILDIRILNTDRHGGNLLVRRVNDGGVSRFGSCAMELIPIDHGLCLPENLEDPYFEWIHWPQASIPFSDEELDYISKLDPEKDAELLQSELPMIHQSCLRVLTLCTIFLKEAAAFGLCLSEIGEMMSRGREDGPSELEIVCVEVKRLVGECVDLLPSPRTGAPEGDQFQFDVDPEDNELINLPTLSAYPAPRLGFCFNNYRSPLSKLEETLEEEDGHDDDDNDEDYDGISNGGLDDEVLRVMKIQEVDKPPPVRRLCVSLKGVSLAERKIPCYNPVGGTVRGGSGNSEQGAHPTADEQRLVSASFVKLGDMVDEEWRVFLMRFQELLPGAFLNRKSTPLKHRLGTSCQF